MTHFAIDLQQRTLVASHGTGHGLVGHVVANLPSEVTDKQALHLSHTLTFMSKCLWRCYTHPASAAMDDLAPNSVGWRRQQSREAFSTVLPAITDPNLPNEHGSMIVCYDPVEESAHRVGRALHAIKHTELTERVVSDIECEIAAISSAELGDLTGRAAQAVHLSRADPSPVQIQAAHQLLDNDPLGGSELFTDLDPTAAAVAAAHWLHAAAEVAGELAGVDTTRVLFEADNITAIQLETPTYVLEQIKTGRTPLDIVTELIRNALKVADGEIPDLDALKADVALAEQRAGEYRVSSPETAAALLKELRVTLLDPMRPARDLLEDLLDGIRGCWTLFREVSFEIELEDEDDEPLDLDDEDEEPEDDEATLAEFCELLRLEVDRD
ncbi:hypothetical protein [Phytomonospora endophytica]|uniref:Uncharacterized protein n=1 Tax=Phytomonospora endophytica TaxID=714109 RepID=A0A841FWF8_9ACTN|nr:hypothetical protein [Phytomonospora endophytica]MBB6037667.1 hypothetical protein [Phytomonospora endophytica]